jgi:hypothetical protein
LAEKKDYKELYKSEFSNYVVLKNSINEIIFQEPDSDMSCIRFHIIDDVLVILGFYGISAFKFYHDISFDNFTNPDYDHIASKCVASKYGENMKVRLDDDAFRKEAEIYIDNEIQNLTESDRNYEERIEELEYLKETLNFNDVEDIEKELHRLIDDFYGDFDTIAPELYLQFVALQYALDFIHKGNIKED